MAYTIESRVIPQALDEVSSTALLPIGTEVQAIDPVRGAGTFKYLKGVASTAIGSWVTYTLKDGQTTRTVADAFGPIGVAMAAIGANQFGWYQIVGKARALMAAAMADAAAVYLTATAGVCDDAVVAGDHVKKALGAETITDAGLADVSIDRPFTDDGK